MRALRWTGPYASEKAMSSDTPGHNRFKISEAYKVSRNTALRAIKLLRDEDLITVEQGWESFVK